MKNLYRSIQFFKNVQTIKSTVTLYQKENVYFVVKRIEIIALFHRITMRHPAKMFLRFSRGNWLKKLKIMNQ